MEIALIYDDNYAQNAEITKKNILKHNPSANIHTITKMEEKYTVPFKYLVGNSHVTKICYLKLYLHNLLPQLDKCLYLDTDIICLDSLQELYDMGFEDNYIIGCESHDYGKIQAEELNIPRYLNTGVMLLNLKELRQDNVTEYINEHAKDCYGKVSYWSFDETVANYLFHDKIKFVSEKWNYCHNRSYNGREQENPKILHIIGRDKEEMLKYA